MSLWWWRNRDGDGELIVSLGDVTWHRVVTSVKADADGGLVLTWEWRRVDPGAPVNWWTDVLVGEVV